MKARINIIRWAVCLMCGIAGTAYAQEVPDSLARGRQEGQPRKVIMSPEKIATQITDRMKESLQLTDKQYKKIYKLNLKEQRELAKAMNGSGQARPPMGEGRRPPMGGPMDGGEPPMRGEGAFQGRRNGQGVTPRGEQSEESREKMEKARKKKEKKIKKILNTEQYEKWKAEQEAAKEKARQRKALPNDGHPEEPEATK